MSETRTVTLELGGRAFGLAPYSIGDLRKAAPFIDSMNDLTRKANELKKAQEDKPEIDRVPPSFTSTMELLHATVSILQVGIAKVEPSMTVEALEEMCNITMLGDLQHAVWAVLEASGFSQGEAKAPAPRGRGKKGA